MPHLGTLGFSIGRGGEIRSIYSYFLSSALHLICSAFLSLGGIYHAIFGREVLDETTDAHIFRYSYQDRFGYISILGAHLGIIGSAGVFNPLLSRTFQVSSYLAVFIFIFRC